MDKYDEAIAYLTAHPEQIVDAWAQDTSGGKEAILYKGRWYPPDFAGCLFEVLRDDYHAMETQDDLAGDYTPGCLTQIADGTHKAPTRALTLAIRADKRIPTDPLKITVDDLPLFKELQLWARMELDRVHE